MSAEKTAPAAPGYLKPLPDLRPEDKPFWDAMKEHRFTLPVGPDGTPFWYPRGRAPGSLEKVTEWKEASGYGTVYTYSIHHYGPTKAYKGDPPYPVALVDLDEGPRMMTNLVKDEEGYPSLDPDQVKIGMRVKIVFHDVTDEITLPKFTPAE
ncbi:MAG: OB-fold domain-containing protein [Acidimicrobiia bacterium]|jgi:uncharacterized OB-fold protein|nr:OB-fold domain-containing protein [Acidimicrobiia bacterium]MCU0934656.1 OB-fold domain-containing protein [Gammaproteobacteria bacterium]